MKPIKVYLQYPWKFPDSPYYKYLIQSPPKGVEYLNAENQKGVITSKRFFWFSNFLKRNIRRVTDWFKLSISNAHLSPEGEYDLIHCAHCLSKNTNKPWVADIEMKHSLAVLWNDSEQLRKKVLKYLSNKNCKKIMPWTEEMSLFLKRTFPEIKDKIEVVYPAIPSKKITKKKRNRINLIFSGRYFYSKGGLHALAAIDKLTRRYPHVYAIFNSDTPKKYIDKYSSNKKISFYGLIPQKKLFELYEQSDILIYPGYSDSFGFAYLEAMSFGIPLVTVGGYARKELVEEGKTGFIIEKKEEINFEKQSDIVVSEIVKKTSVLIENNKLRNQMSKNCLEEVKSGRFSIKERNKKLKRIYEEAIK